MALEREIVTGVADGAGIIERAIAAGVFPAATVDVGSVDGTLWQKAFGRLTFDESAPATEASTVFDLASLAKPIATTSVVMDLVARERLHLDDRVAAFFPEWLGEDRSGVTMADLLEHASGLPARLPDGPPGGRREFEHEICAVQLEYVPRTKALYSDLGFLLLGFLAADRGEAALDLQFTALRARLSEVEPALASEPLGYRLGVEERRRAAPVDPLEGDRRCGRRLIGEVQDDYAAALGGVAGHAGVFGTAGSVGAFARLVLRAARGDRGVPAPFTPDLLSRATRRSAVPGSSRALGWDTMLPTSSCGTRMSASAFGHVGFTGTSLWIDPERDRYFVLLTNRVCGGGSVDAMRDVRRAFHDALSR